MSELIKKGKKMFTVGVVLTTIIWSAGFGAFLPLTAGAQALQAGDLIKSPDLSSVYYYSQDGKRYVFPNEKTYTTWYSDFSTVKTISAAELAAIPIGGNVVYRPGVKMIKIVSDPKVYAVGANGSLHWVETEAVAVALYGPNWNTMIQDVPDAFFTNYTVGASISDANDFDPAAETAAATSIDVNMGLQGGGAQQGGTLSVSLAATNPSSQNIPKYATNVSYLEFNVTGPGSFTSLMAMRGGLGESSDFEEVYLYRGNERITDGRSVNQSTHKVTFSGLNENVPAGQTWTYKIVADMSNPTDGPSNHFYIANASAFETGASVNGSFPIRGNNMTVVDAAQVGTLTIEKAGSVSNPTVGQKDAVIAKFSLEAATEDISVERLALKLKGSINEDEVTNAELWQGSTKLAEVSGANDRELLNFILGTPYLLEDGEEKNFEVRADLGGESGETVHVFLDEDTDLVGIGQDFGYGVRVTSTNYDDSANDGTDSTRTTLEGGDVTISFNGPSAGDVAVDGQDVPFLDLTWTAEREVTVKEFDVVVTAVSGASANGGLVNDGSGEANLQDIKLREVDGGTLMGPEELSTGGSDTAQTLTFTDDFTMNAGSSMNLQITADVDDNTPADEIYRMTLDVSTLDIEDEQNDAVTDIIPGADIVGHNQTAVESGVTVTLSSNPSSTTRVSGEKGVPVVAFLFEAEDTSDVTITDLDLAAYMDDDGTSSAGDWSKGTDDGVSIRDLVSSVSLFDGNTGVKIDGPEDVDTNGDVQFENFDWTVPAGSIKKLEVRVDFSTNAPNGGNDDLITFDIDDLATDITAEDEDGDDVDASGEDSPNSDDAGGAGTAISNAANQPNTFTTLTDSGALTVSVDPSDPDPEVVVAGSTNVLMYALKLEADTEAFLVEKIRIANLANADNASLAQISAQYPKKDGSTGTKTANVTNGATNGIIDFNFSGADRVYVAADDDAVVQFFASFTTLNPNVGGSPASGNTPQFDFDIANDSNFKAIGEASGETLDGGDITDNTVAGQAMVLRKTKPTVTLAAGSPSGAGIPGFNEVLRFNVAADAKEDVDVRGFCFDLVSTDNGSSSWNHQHNTDASGVDDSDFSLYLSTDLGNQLESEDTDWVLHEDNGCGDAAETGTPGDQVESVLLDLTDTTDDTEVVAKGSTKTFVLKIETTLASAADDDSVRVDVEDITWHDNNAQSATDITGTNVDNLPVTGGTIVY